MGQELTPRHRRGPELDEAEHSPDTDLKKYALHFFDFVTGGAVFLPDIRWGIRSILRQRGDGQRSRGSGLEYLDDRRRIQIAGSGAGRCGSSDWGTHPFTL